MSLITVVQVLDDAPTIATPGVSAGTAVGTAVSVGTGSVNYSFTSTNPYTAGTISYLITWGGGTPTATDAVTAASGAATAGVAHTYTAGTYSLVVRATDIEGSVATKTYTVTAA